MYIKFETEEAVKVNGVWYYAGHPDIEIYVGGASEPEYRCILEDATKDQIEEIAEIKTEEKKFIRDDIWYIEKTKYIDAKQGRIIIKHEIREYKTVPYWDRNKTYIEI